jgi:hypothetical protein
VLSYLRGQHMAQLPEELRNMILELYLGNGRPAPAHGGEGAPGREPGEGPGGGKPPAQPQGFIEPFELQAEASTVPLVAAALAATEARVARESDLEIAAAALAGGALAAWGRSVRTFDPATGRFVEHRAESRQERVELDRARFVGTGIDW